MLSQLKLLLSGGPGSGFPTSPKPGDDPLKRAPFCSWSEEDHPSAAKAAPILPAFAARLKSCPDTLLILQEGRGTRAVSEPIFCVVALRSGGRQVLCCCASGRMTARWLLCRRHRVVRRATNRVPGGRETRLRRFPARGRGMTTKMSKNKSEGGLCKGAAAQAGGFCAPLQRPEGRSSLRPSDLSWSTLFQG